MLDQCTFLDPRVKAMPYISNQEREIIRDKVLDLCVQDVSTSGVNVSVTEIGDGDGSESADKTGGGTESCKPLSSLLGDSYGSNSKQASVLATSSIVDVITFEIRRYLQQPPCNMSVCPLQW